MYLDNKIAVVIPCYNVAQHIERVVGSLPDFIDSIVLIDDHSADSTASILASLAAADSRLHLISHSENQGVGGAMISGFNYAMTADIDIVVKIDGDGQMDSAFIAPLLDSMTADTHFVKGNRLYDRKSIGRMPALRHIGNVGLGFMVKSASGYWGVTDPVNGFFAIRTTTLRKMEMERIAKRFFFESSLLIEMHYTGARIREVTMPAIYADERSNLSIAKVLFSFPPRLFRAWLRRIYLSYFIYDFNLCSVYILLGLPSFLFGLIFGLCQWIHYASIQSPSPTGTIMVAVLTFILGFQMLLAAIQYDVSARNPFEE